MPGKIKLWFDVLAREHPKGFSWEKLSQQSALRNRLL